VSARGTGSRPAPPGAGARPSGRAPAGRLAPVARLARAAPLALFWALALAACAPPPPGPREVEQAVARLMATERTYLDVTPEEFLVLMEERERLLDVVLDALAGRAGESAAGDAILRDLQARRAQLEVGLVDLSVAPLDAWPEHRNRLVALADDLQRDLIAAWSAT